MTPATWNRNWLTSKLGIDYPIIQGPLGGLSSQRLTAAVSNFGGLGSFGAIGLSPGAIKDVIAEIRSLTSKPIFFPRFESEGTIEISNAVYQNKSKVVVRLPGSSVVEHAAVKRELQIH